GDILERARRVSLPLPRERAIVIVLRRRLQPDQPRRFPDRAVKILQQEMAAEELLVHPRERRVGILLLHQLDDFQEVDAGSEVVLLLPVAASEPEVRVELLRVELEAAFELGN